MEQYSDTDQMNDYQVYMVVLFNEIDFGMASELKKNDHKNMIKFLKASCMRDPKLCVKYVAKLSHNYDPSKLLFKITLRKQCAEREAGGVRGRAGAVVRRDQGLRGGDRERGRAGAEHRALGAEKGAAVRRQHLRLPRQLHHPGGPGQGPLARDEEGALRPALPHEPEDQEVPQRVRLRVKYKNSVELIAHLAQKRVRQRRLRTDALGGVVPQHLLHQVNKQRQLPLLLTL